MHGVARPRIGEQFAELRDEIRAVSAVYRAAGYRIELVVLAVAEAVSQLAVLQRFFGPDADGGGRYVAWDNQDACTTGLPNTVALVEAERLVDRVMVVRRGLVPLYDNELAADGWIRREGAAAVVRAERLRPWDGPQTRVFRRDLVRAEVLVHDERLPADRRLAVSRDTERAAAAAEPVRRAAQRPARNRLPPPQQGRAHVGLRRADRPLLPAPHHRAGEPSRRLPRR
ncbi:zeta toxin family protein [Streptomyces sp. NPDC048331]|uniref:zeta toxin family protein n=1 Tax=Streptomyces sp. NPDC048331 TaxID=3365534 RepID=UPI00371B1A09